MKLLITGGFGYLGGRLAQFIAAQSGYEIELGSRQQKPPPFWLPQAKVVKCQWDSSVKLNEICKGVDTIVHMAGMNAEDCVSDPVAALEFNGVGTVRLVHSAIQQSVKRFVYLSTAHVYGNPLTGVITEKNCPIATHPYATSHRAGEDAVIDAHERGDIEGVVIRLSNSFGVPAHKGVNCWMLLVNDLCRQAVMNGHMVLRSTGLQRRDFVALTDVCRAIQHLIELSKDHLGNGLFNVGGSWSPTVLEMTQLVAERIFLKGGVKPKITAIENNDNEEILTLDYQVSKLIKTGFNNIGDIESEIDGVISFCQDNLG